MILRGSYSSDILRTTTNVQFLIPDKMKGPYKAAYLLHGLHANHGAWMDYSMLPYYAKKYDIIFVMPEVGRSFYCDVKYGRKYFSFLCEELPEICRNIFNISTKREDNAVIGYSMGGYGALRMALSKPQEYSFCGSISPACLFFKPILDTLRNNESKFKYMDDIETEELKKDLYAIYGEKVEYNPEYDVIEQLKKFPDNLPKPKIYVTCGTEDSLLKENHAFHNIIKEMSFDYTYEEWQGDHDWDFFNEAMKKTLEFWRA